MINSLKNMLFNDWKWKLCALGFAVALWFICMNVTGTIIKVETIGVPLTIRNQDRLEEMVLQNEAAIKSTTVYLQVKGKQEEIERLKNDKDKIAAYINLGLMELRYIKNPGEPQSTLIYIDIDPLYRGVEVLNRTPRDFVVVIDKYETETKEVTVVPMGVAAEDYKYVKSESEPVNVKISGARSTLAKVAEIRAEVDIKDKTSGVELDVEPKAYDIDGYLVSGVEIKPETVNVKVSINKLGKIPILKPSYILEPPEGYVVTDIEWEPKYVEVIGLEEDIADMNPISLPDEDVSSLTDSKVYPYDLRAFLPSTLQIVNGTPQDAFTTITIERLVEKELNIQVKNLNIKGYTFTTEFMEETIPITIQAVESVIGNIDENDIIGSVDLAGLVDGVYTVPVDFILPEGVGIVGEQPTAEVTVSGNTPAETALPDTGDVTPKPSAASAP